MKAALAFDRSARSVSDLKKFWSEDPLGAASWLSKVKQAAVQPLPELDAVAKILSEAGTDAMKASKLRELAAITPQLFEVVGDYGAHQAARSSTLGWEASAADPWPEAPAFTGTLRLVDGKPTLETTRGNYTLELGTPNWRDEPETVFLDRTVTIKGFPSADGKSLSMEQFAPGSSADYVAGRILVEGDRVFISPNGDQPLSAEILQAAGLPVPEVLPDAKPPPRAEITDPAFKKLLLGDQSRGLANYAPAGVILPGKVEVKDGVAVYTQKPEAFYLLGRFQIPNVKDLPHGKVLHQIETGYFHATDAVASKKLEVPAELMPGGHVDNPPGDTTIGGVIAANKGEGRRTFFYVNVLPNDATVEGAELHGERKMEVSWLGRVADLGMHGEATEKATNLRDVAMSVPAASTSNEGFAPADAVKVEQ